MVVGLLLGRFFHTSQFVWPCAGELHVRHMCLNVHVEGVGQPAYELNLPHLPSTIFGGRVVEPDDEGDEDDEEDEEDADDDDGDCLVC